MDIPENQPLLPVLDPKYWSFLDLKLPHRAYIRSETAEKYQIRLARVCNTHMYNLKNFEKKYFLEYFKKSEKLKKTKKSKKSKKSKKPKKSK